MITVKIRKLVKIMRCVRRISFLFCFVAFAFFAYIGYSGLEHNLTDIGMAVLTLIPLVILVVVGRWWEGLTAKRVFEHSVNKRKDNKHIKKFGHVAVETGAGMSEVMHG